MAQSIHFLCKRMSPLAVAASIAIVLTTSAVPAQETGGGVAVGGIGRFVSGRWGLVKGVVSNRTGEPVTLTPVITPPDSNGLQYARRIQLPPMTSRSVQWPMLMPDTEAGLKEVPFVIVSEDGGEKVVRSELQNRARSFTTNLRLTEYGHTGLIAGNRDSNELTLITQMLRTMLRAEQREDIVLSVNPKELDGSAHALDGLDQLCVASTELQRYPEACDAIRLWVQRGGRLMIVLTEAGMDVAGQLVGDALPMTLVDRTSSNAFKLDLNPEYPPMRFNVREVEREFPEPVQLMRVIPERGEVIWSTDDWPAAIATDYGRGRILLTTISTAVFVKPDQGTNVAMIPSSQRFSEILMRKPRPRLLARDQAVATANEQVGYSIPSRGFAMSVVIGFPLILLAAGIWLLKRGRGELLIWVVPAIAVLACLPAAWKGWSSRTIAPQTVIRQRVVRAIDGETLVASDGFATVYSPANGPLALSGDQRAIFNPETDPNNRNYRRLLWTSSGDSEWANLEPPVGMRTAVTREIMALDTPLQARASFSEAGIVGTLGTATFKSPTDALLAGSAPDRQAVKIEGASWTTGADDVLAGDEFFTSTLLSQRQLQRKAVFKSIFEDTSFPFPSQLSMLYWAETTESALKIGANTTRSDGSVLVVQPVKLMPPEAGQPITIPPAVLPYRAIPSDNNDFSTVYNNGQRKWSSTEQSAEVTLAFEVPNACLPFEVTEAELKIRTFAGSRTFEVLSGPRDNLSLVEAFESPVGVRTTKLPLKTIGRGESVYVRFRISEANIEREEDVTAVDQDEAWKIERVLLTLKGSRKAD
ncbi:MAG: hypothetical protein AB8G99_04165 [Planctomycetaceae bacterium]